MKINIVFISLILLLTLFYGMFDTMNRGPYSRHQWRQADCLSITQHYFQDDLPFLEPEIHWKGEGESGKTISEFPIIYYGVGKIWQLFGKNYWVYRSINFLIVVLGLYYLKKLVKLILKSDFWSVIIPLFLFTSPALVYYSNNFLMNANALSLALIASYHFFRYRNEGSMKHLIFASLIFLFAGLLKITALLLFFAFGAIILYEIIWKEREFKTRWKELVPFACTLLGISLWQAYVAYYNAENMSNVFLQGILPIWKIGADQISLIWYIFREDVLPEFFNTWILVLLLLLFTIVLVNFRRLNKYLRALLLFISLEIIFYFVLFYQVFNIHEYYLINLLVIIPLIIIISLLLIKDHYPGLFQSKWLKITGLFLLIFSAYYSRIKTIIKYDVGSAWIRTSIFTPEKKKRDWQFYHWNYYHTLKDLETIEPYLEKIGVRKEDRVISIPDASINISLYLMNRNGFCDYGYSHLAGSKRIEEEIKWGAKYLIINDKAILEEEYLKPFLTNKIGETEFITIYAIGD